MTRKLNLESASSHTEQNVHRQLVQTFIRQLLSGKLNSVERKRSDSVGFGATVTAERLSIFRWSGLDFRQECLNLRIFIKLPRLVFENQIISHTARGKFPDSGFI